MLSRHEPHDRPGPYLLDMNTNRKAATLLAISLAATGPLSAQRPDSLAQAPDSAAQARLQALADRLAAPGQQPGIASPDTPGQATTQTAPRQATADTLASAIASPPPPNPFSSFSTHHLSNGLKVWFKRLPDAPNVSISVGVPVGSDADPPGKEQLAHFTEHMLFSDHDGRTEQEIKDAVEALGGRRNGFTYRDHTWYYVTIAQEHGLFAIEWLSGLMEPHAMEPEVVERNREPVALEIGSKPREFFEHLWFALNPSWLMPADFWEREFGMDTRTMWEFDRWRSLQRITPEDLRGFYDRHYAPAAMTLTIVGDLDENLALATAEQTFGTLAPKDVTRLESEIEDPARAWSNYSWAFRPNVRYTARYKLFEPSAEDQLMTLFIRDLLSRRLNERLRYGERKAVYGLLTSMVMRGPAAYLQLRGDINEDEYEYAETVIAEELEFLRSGSLDPAEFEADRTAIIERLRSASQTSESLNFWVRRSFYDPDTFTDFPDLLGLYENVSQGEIVAFAARNLVDTRRELTVSRIEPMTQGMTVALIALLVWIAFKAVAWSLTTPVEMKNIRYVARFRQPALLLVISVLASLAMGLVLVRLVIAGFIWVGGTWVATVDDYWIQSGSYSAMLVSLVAILVVYVSRSPRKLLVFDDHLRVKHVAYRSRVFKPEDIAELSTRRFHNVWFSKDVFRSYPLTFGLIRRGVWLKPKKGRGYFFRTRDTKELIDVLGGWLGRPVVAGGTDVAVSGATSGGPVSPSAEPTTPDAERTPPRTDSTTPSAEPVAPSPAPTTEAKKGRGWGFRRKGKAEKDKPEAEKGQSETAGPAKPPAKSGAAAGDAAAVTPSPKSSAPPTPDSSPTPDEAEEDIDFDDVGLTEEEMRELLGEE